MQVKHTQTRTNKPGNARAAQYPHIISVFNKELA